MACSNLMRRPPTLAMRRPRPSCLSAGRVNPPSHWLQFSSGADLTGLSSAPTSAAICTYLIGDTGLIFAEGQIDQISWGSRDASGRRGLAEFTASALGAQVGFSNARVISVTGRDIPTDGSDAITIPTECIGDVDGDGEVDSPTR